MTPDRSAAADDGAARRRARREVARRLHPDVGGDPDAFVAAMAKIDGAPDTGHRPHLQVRTDRLTRARRTLARAARQAKPVRRLRARLPRAVPGSRRWVDL